MEWQHGQASVAKGSTSPFINRRLYVIQGRTDNQHVSSYDQGGPNSSLVDQEYISTHFQIGPLGSHYPDIAYIMEGDSPSLMVSILHIGRLSLWSEG